MYPQMAFMGSDASKTKVRRGWWVLAVPFAGLPLAMLQAGCFSMAAQGGISGSRNPPVVVKGAAAAADLATLPVQIGVVALAGAVQSMKPAPAPRPKTLAEEIVANPEIIFSRKLDLANDQTAIGAVSQALWQPEAKFTDAQLRQLYGAMGPAQHTVLRNRHCSEEFLREVFATISGVRTSHEKDLVINMVENTALPLDLLEAIAADEKRYDVGARWARQRLELRKQAGSEL